MFNPANYQNILSGPSVHFKVMGVCLAAAGSEHPLQSVSPVWEYQSPLIQIHPLLPRMKN